MLEDRLGEDYTAQSGTAAWPQMNPGSAGLLRRDWSNLFYYYYSQHDNIDLLWPSGLVLFCFSPTSTPG